MIMDNKFPELLKIAEHWTNTDEDKLFYDKFIPSHSGTLTKTQAILIGKELKELINICNIAGHLKKEHN